MATQPVSPFASFAASTAPNVQKSSSTKESTGAEPDKQMFLQLLVAQLKNQDPLNPTDGTQFVSQLAQFSNLEQTIAIRQNTDSINQAIGAVTSGGYPGTGGDFGTENGPSVSPFAREA